MSTITKDLGVVTAYGYAVSKGYTGTEEEFAELMASYATVAEQAAQSAQTATQKAEAAAQAVLDAVSAKDSAVQAKTDAETARDSAAGSASSASRSASSASGSASSASQSAGAAQTSAESAAGSASAANQSASDAETAKTDAETAKTGAETAQGKAEEAQAKSEEAANEATLAVTGVKKDISILKQFHMSELTPALVKQIVQNGNARDWFPIGYQFAEDWYRDAATKYISILDVVHHYDNNDMALCWHYAIPDGIQFDAPEAIYYFDGTETAGDYYIPVGSAYGAGWTVGLNIQITLTEAPSAGDQLFIDCGTNYANDPTAGRAWRVYEAGTNTVKQSGTTSNGTSGTNLGTIGNVNAHRPNGRLNAISRVVYGYGRWSQSAIRQYLNSTEAAGAWWTMQNPWDRPPSQLASLRGFLAGYSEEFLDIIEAVDVVTALNTQEGFSETTETTQDRIFLPSLQEWYIVTQLANVEGEDWDYNKQLAEEDGRTGRFPTGTAIDILKRYNIASQSSSVNVWLRSAYRYDASSAWLVATSGYVYSDSAYYALRGCPACKIKATA